MRYQYLKEEGKYSPIIPIRLKGEEGWVTFNAYVDSGATYSVFRAEIATEILGINIEEGEKLYVTVGDGSLITVYLRNIMVDLGGKIFEVIIGFSKQLGIGFNIIGRKDIFDNFIVSFNEKEKYVEFIEN